MHVVFFIFKDVGLLPLHRSKQVLAQFLVFVLSKPFAGTFIFTVNGQTREWYHQSYYLALSKTTI